MKHLPLIIGYGGMNSAGISSNCQGYRNMVFPALGTAEQEKLLASLSALTGGKLNGREVRAASFIRPIHKDTHFNTNTAPYYRVNGKPEPFPVGFAAGLAAGFQPGDHYPSRHHPRGLQMAVFAAADAINSTGLTPAALRAAVAPERISVYAGSALGQLDDRGMGGVLTAELRKQKIITKNLPFSYPQMAADFVNAYILNNVGRTGNHCGACATFLYNLAAAAADIKQGETDLAFVGASEAPILSSVIAAFYNMGAMIGNSALGDRKMAHAAMPFGDNHGFVMGESAQFVVLASEEAVHRTGATVFGMVGDVFVHADGVKRSISSPGPGNYITVGRAAAALAAEQGAEILQKKSYILAHGTSTPQNRVTESRIFSAVAGAFGIADWKVVAIKSFVGHSQAAAGGDQLAVALGVWRYGILPGIVTVEQLAEDVSQDRLAFVLQHLPLAEECPEAALINAKGFGGNNATAVVYSPRLAKRLYAKRIGKKKLAGGTKKQRATRQAAADYFRLAEAGQWQVYYDFNENPPSPEDIRVTKSEVVIKGLKPVSLRPPV